MSIAQIPQGTRVPDLLPPQLNPHTVIPVGTILKETTVIPQPLQVVVDTRDPARKIGVELAPPGSIIPDGVYLPVGTFIPQPVPVGVILPRHTILPMGSKVPDETSIPYGSIVAEGTQISEEQILSGILDSLGNWWKRFRTSRGYMKQIPLGTVIPSGTVFPVGSIIQRKTNFVYTSNASFELSIPQGTVIPNAEELKNTIDSAIYKAIQDAKGARLPKEIIICPQDPQQTTSNPRVYLPPGTVIPKFSNGDYAVIPVGTVIPLLANGAAATIPENKVFQLTDREENNVAKGTRVPAGAKIPPGTVIPAGALIPSDVILYVPKLADGRHAIVPPYSVIPPGAIFPEGLAEIDLNIPYGTAIPKSSTKSIHITPDTEVSENFQLQPSGEVKNVVVTKGTYIPKTDMPINIPKGTIITANVPWTVRTPTVASLMDRFFDGNAGLKLFAMIHTLLILVALNIAFQLRDTSGILLAVLLPELYLFTQIRRIAQTGETFLLNAEQIWGALFSVIVIFLLMTVW